MPKRIDLDTALYVWEQAQETGEDARIHPSGSLLRTLACQPGMKDRERWLEHLVVCRDCRARFFALLEESGETCGPQRSISADVFYPKAAAGGDEHGLEKPTRIVSESGKFMVSIRKNLEDENSCLLSLSVVDQSAGMEGAWITVKDKTGRRLVHGRITGGKLSALIPDSKSIAFNFISVISEDCGEEDRNDG